MSGEMAPLVLEAERGPVRVRRPRGSAPVAVTLPASLTAAAVTLPLVYIFVRAIQGGWAAYADSVFDSGVLWLTVRTVGLAAGVVLLTAAISLPAAWLVTRTDLPGRRIWAVLVALPLVFPSYVAAFVLVAAFGPRGYLQGWLAPLGIERLPELVYGYTGALLALGLFNYPYVFLLLVASLRGLDPSLEESSRSLGKGRWRTFFRVTLPQLVPSLASGSVLVALYAFSDFGAVSITRYDTFTLSIYNAYRALFDRSAAASLSTVLVLLTVILLWAQVRILNRSRPGRLRPSRPAERIRLGVWRWPSLLGLGALVSLTLLAPLAVILGWAVRALRVGHPLGAAWEASVGSLGAALVTAVAASVLALPVAFWAVRYGSKAARAAELLTSAGYALPGIVIALSLVFFATRMARPLYQTPGLLVFAYLIRFLPEAVAAVRSTLGGISPRFEEAGRSLGRGPIEVLRTLTLPLIRPGVLAGAGLVFLTTLKELPATLILRPIGFETLAVRVWSTAAEGIYSEAAVPALCLLVVSAPVMYLLVVRSALATRESR